MLENLSFLINADKSRPQSVILRAKNGLTKIKLDRWNFSSGTLAKHASKNHSFLVLHAKCDIFLSLSFESISSPNDFIGNEKTFEMIDINFREFSSQKCSLFLKWTLL